MNIPARFSPARRSGLIFHGGVILLLVGIGGTAFWLAVQQDVGAYFLLWMLFSGMLLIFVPWLLYRAYALLQARYILEREGLRIRWGLRAEDLPLPAIEWIRPANEMGFELPLPRFSWIGAILGKKYIEGLGEVEFMASDTANMLIIATPQRVYAISPDDPALFLRTFQRTMELGSPSPLESYTAVPTVFFNQVWSDQAARYLLLCGFFLAIILFVVVALLIPARSQVSLGFDLQGLPQPPGPSERLLLLPILAGFTFIMDFLTGLFWYRLPARRPAAYLLWVGGILTPIFLLAAVFYQK
jgi:hypothetical protein